MEGKFFQEDESGRFNVLNLVSIPLPEEYLWLPEETDEDNAVGVYFYAFDKNEQGQPLASICVADSTKDPSEPDLSILIYDNEQVIIDAVKKEISNGLAECGVDLIEWGPCCFNPLYMLSGLLVSYDIQSDGKVLRNITYRASVKGHKIVLIGSFPADEDALGRLLSYIIYNVTLLSGGNALRPLEPIFSKESPRKILATHFENSVGDLPISGGWGYSVEDACVIERHDQAAPSGVEFDATRIQAIFVEKRIYEEMNIFRPEEEKFSGIGWDLARRKKYNLEGKTFEKLTYTVTAFLCKDWEELKSEWEGPNGFGSKPFDLESHQKKRNERQIRLAREFWFDITSCETVPLFGISFPWSIDELIRGGLIHYELTQPGLGFSVPYHGDGISMTIYVYDKGLPEIPINLNDDFIKEHFEGVLSEVLQSPIWKKAEFLKAYGFGRHSKEIEFLCGEFSVIDTEGVDLDSYIYLTTHSDKFIKIRISIRSHKNTLALANAFAFEVLQLFCPERTSVVIN